MHGIVYIHGRVVKLSSILWCNEYLMSIVASIMYTLDGVYSRRWFE